LTLTALLLVEYGVIVVLSPHKIIKMDEMLKSKEGNFAVWQGSSSAREAMITSTILIVKIN
jgi:hypothetical protein